MILVIAEKPSVAQSIAKVLGATSRKDGYLEGNNYIVSWCVGHLVGLADASSYNERYAKWRYDDLPIVPEEWLFEVPKDKAQQFKILRDLIKDKRVTELVCATDAGREGELIFRLVYHKAGCTKPFKRLWISSLEDAAIREGFNHLRDGSDYDKLYEAALSRSKADWIVGINGTRLFTTLYKKKLVVGRVQTPTLAMLVEREGKITTFHKEKYFNVHVERDGLIADMEKIKTEEEAKTIAAACDKKQAVVSSVRKETKTVNPPKLYDLTTLQREANRYFSFTAQQTLDLVQSLYEKKLLTYPRTDSQFITDDMEGTARKVIDIICRKVSIFDGIRHDPDMKRIINNAKVTDHHAIIPTVQLEKQDISELPQSEQKVLSLVGMRLLAATGEKHIYDETRITLSCEGYEFKSKGKTVTQEGWKAVEQRFKASLKTKDKEDPEKVLPAVNENDILSPVSASVTEHYTTPPKPYTEDTLVNLFINQFKDLLPDKAQEQIEAASIPTPNPEKAAAPKHRLTPEEKQIKDAVMDTLKARIAYANDGMRSTVKASEQSHKLMAQHKIKIEGNTVTQNGEPMFAIHRRYSAKKTQGCYRELTPTLEYIRQEKAQEAKQEKPSIREQLKAAAKAQPERKAPARAKKHDMGLE